MIMVLWFMIMHWKQDFSIILYFAIFLNIWMDSAFIISYVCSTIHCKREMKGCLKPGSLAKIGLILMLDPDVKRLLFWIEDFETYSGYSGRRLLTILQKKTIFLWQHLKINNFKLSRLWPYLHVPLIAPVMAKHNLYFTFSVLFFKVLIFGLSYKISP